MLVTRQLHSEHEVLKWLALLTLAAALTFIFARQIHGTYCGANGAATPPVPVSLSSFEP
jgi:hypothetical protein